MELRHGVGGALALVHTPNCDGGYADREAAVVLPHDGNLKRRELFLQSTWAVTIYYWLVYQNVAIVRAVDRHAV